jgi:peptide-methionine (S)-S-oxide reductase
MFNSQNVLLFVLAIVALMACTQVTNATTEKSKKMDDNTKYQSLMDTADTKGLEVATLGGGCFWCIEAVFDELKGVEKSVSGYSGGVLDNPTYRQVCSGNTGHAEVINVYFDPKVISFEDILRVFFHVHDPTTLNRQGADAGTQYRSSIFYHSEAQKASAEKIIAETEKNKLWSDKIVTEVAKFERFYAAEDYHQEYFKLNGSAPYCSFVISPKMKKFRTEFKDKLKTE